MLKYTYEIGKGFPVKDEERDMKMSIVFVINGVEEVDEFHWELSELSRKFPTASFMFKKDGRTSTRYEGLPILDEPLN